MNLITLIVVSLTWYHNDTVLTLQSMKVIRMILVLLIAKIITIKRNILVGMKKLVADKERINTLFKTKTKKEDEHAYDTLEQPQRNPWCKIVNLYYIYSHTAHHKKQAYQTYNFI